MRRPSIILIVVDTLRADYLGCYGGRGTLTKNIDGLASRGVRFSNAYSASNFTASAFASLFTSLYPASHGIYDFKIMRQPPSAPMEVVRENGYLRKAVVDFGFFKSFLGESFDEMESLTDFAPNWSTEGPVVETRRAVEWIAQRKDTPFFLFFHISPTHAPYRFPKTYYDVVTGAGKWAEKTRALRADEVLGAFFPNPKGERIPQEEIDRFNRCVQRVRDVPLDEGLVSVIRELYRLEVRVADDMVGLLVDELERLGMIEDTVLSFCSDHGEELWDHGKFGHGTSAMYNEVIRTPWILCQPARFATPMVVDANVSHINILPTLLDVAGVELTSEMKSKSVRGLFDPASGKTFETGGKGVPPVFCETGQRVGVLLGDLKLVAPSRRVRFTSVRERLRSRVLGVVRRLLRQTRVEVELYDLRTDPGENSNVAKREKTTVAALMRLIDEYYRAPGIRIAKGKALSPEEEEQIKKELEGLGYL